ncbi:MAG: hypothetical protein R3318_02895, partial [Gammaproteobacteria bacterium]|nr:hypothetical protein [Gammaproteobacteria bacterium]
NQTQLHALDLSMTFEGLDQLLASDLHDEHDLLILEYPVVHQEDIQKIKQATRHARCKKVLLVYAYCNKKVLGNLELEGVEVLPAPVVPGLIDRRSQELFQMHTRGPGNNVIDLELDHDPTERRFDDATLAKVVNVATSINCECPHHLADIIYKLAAFEEYSASCESRNVQDRQLHSMLYNVTSRTRALFEDTLARVIEHEGIEINK